MIFNSTVATGDADNWQGKVAKEAESASSSATEAIEGLDGKMDKVNPTGSGSMIIEMSSDDYLNIGNYNNGEKESNFIIGKGNTLRADNDGYKPFETLIEGHYHNITGNVRNTEVSGYGHKVYGGQSSHIEGDSNTMYGGNENHIEGYYNTAYGGVHQTHEEGYNNEASKTTYSHIEGFGNVIAGPDEGYISAGHIEGMSNHLIGSSNETHVEGNQNRVHQTNHTHVEGANHYVYNGYCNHVEGYNNNLGTSTDSDGDSSTHIEGSYNKTYGGGGQNHLEGSGNTINNTTYQGHIEGGYNTLIGETYQPHVEGYSNTVTRGHQSHIEGQGNVVDGAVCTHVEGYCNKASKNYQHVEGKYNEEDTEGKYAHIIGNGTDSYNRSNAMTVDWDGNLKVSGTITDGDGNVLGPGGGASSLAELEDVNITNPENGQGLVYDSESEKFINAAVAQPEVFTNTENGLVPAPEDEEAAPARYLNSKGSWVELDADIQTYSYEYYLEHKTELEESGKPYIIEGNVGGAFNAKGIDYNNSESKLEATNVQDAIDEANTNLNNTISITNGLNDILKNIRFDWFKSAKVTSSNSSTFIGFDITFTPFLYGNVQLFVLSRGCFSRGCIRMNASTSDITYGFSNIGSIPYSSNTLSMTKVGTTTFRIKASSEPWETFYVLVWGAGFVPNFTIAEVHK